jgi:vancomycin resistance protein YoaR
MRRKRSKRKKKKVIRVMMLGLLCTVALVGYITTQESKSAATISKGVYVEDVSLGGKKLSEAESLLQEKYGQPVLSKNIHIQTNNNTYTLDFDKLKAKYNITEAVEEAFNYGKKKSFLENLFSKESRSPKNLKLEFTYDSKPIDDLIAKIEKETKKDAVNAKITSVNGVIKVTPEVEGIKLQKDQLKQAIIDSIKAESSSQDINIIAPFEVSKPEVTSKILSTINTKISSFSTNFSTSIPERINNIELATKAVNGTTLLPGEEFSFNGTVGERTKARGYKEAGVIIGDKIESGLGGGICQVSSTLYNAVLTANLKVVERRNHSLPLGYVGKGLDATVDWGNIDFKFKNSYDVPVYIEGYTKNKNLYFNLYSTKEAKTRTYHMFTEIIETLQPTVKFVDDPNLPEGQTQVVKKPSIGYKVKVYKKIFENGQLIDTELVSSDNYRLVDGETIRGTKKLINNGDSSTPVDKPTDKPVDKPTTAGQ